MHHFFRNIGIVLGGSLRHIFRNNDPVITAAVLPVWFMLLFVYVISCALLLVLETNAYFFTDSKK